MISRGSLLQAFTWLLVFMPVAAHKASAQGEPTLNRALKPLRFQSLNGEIFVGEWSARLRESTAVAQEPQDPKDFKKPQEPAFFPAWNERSRGYTKVPGQMGVNALRPIPTSDPRPVDSVTLSTGIEMQRDRRRDYSGTLNISAEIPVGDSAQLTVRGSVVEYFDVSKKTVEEFDLDTGSGWGGGELFFGSKFLFMKEREDRAQGDLALELWVTPTTGSSEHRRYTDASRFEANLLYGKTVHRAESATADLQAVRLRGKLGFTNWNIDADHQDDAVTYGIGTECYFKGGTVLDIDLRGYYGYIGDDAPLEIATTYSFPIAGRWSCSVGGSLGITEEAPDATGMFSLSYSF